MSSKPQHAPLHGYYIFGAIRPLIDVASALMGELRYGDFISNKIRCLQMWPGAQV